jgi:hypothetical protein
LLTPEILNPEWSPQGDIKDSTFQANSAPKGKAIFRTVSAGDLSSNRDLNEDTQVGACTRLEECANNSRMPTAAIMYIA